MEADKKLHIGIVGPIFLPSLNINFIGDRTNWPIGLGGTPVNHEINALIRLGYKVSVFSLCTSLESDKFFEFNEGNLSLYIGPYRKRARHRCIDLFYNERNYLKSAILKANPKVIHAHWQYEWAWAAINSKIPTLVTCHDSPLNVLRNQFDAYRLIRLLMAYFTLKKAKNITAVSPYTANSLRYLTSKIIKVIPNFEPKSVFSYFKEKNVPQLKIKIAMINNGFFGLKNVEMGIKSFQVLQNTFSQIELHLFGIKHGIDEDAHKWCLKNNVEIKNIFFHGSNDFSSLMDSLSKCDILLHTSLEESCPMVLIEAMAMGIPSVAGSNSGGVPWVLNQGGGVLVDVKSIKSIIEGIKFIILKLDEKDYSRKIKNIALNRFSEEIVMKEYIQELSKLTNKII